jgi:hypothetical protein
VLIAAAVSTGVMLALAPPQPATPVPSVTAVLSNVVNELADSDTDKRADSEMDADPKVQSPSSGAEADERDEIAGTVTEADDGDAVTPAARSLSQP